MRCCSIEKRDRTIIEKIIRYCERINENLVRCEHDYCVFAEDYLYQDACCMCIVQIGELTSQLSDEVKMEYSSVPWRVIKDTRNFYVHDYGSIDVPSVWATLNEDIPALKEECEVILEKDDGGISTASQTV